MYLTHFGLDRYPFTLTPDTEFFLDHGGFKEVLDVLECVLSSGEGFTKVTGEVGTGKTLMCRKLLNSLDERYVTAFIPNPFVNPRALQVALAKELGIKNSGKFGQYRLLELINARLLSLHAEGKQVVLLMDEAQSLPDESMEALRLLSNFETEKSKLLQVVLFGQPELDIRLQQSHLRQLRQRILFSCALEPIPHETLNVYVRHRLQVAGYRGKPMFSPSSLTLLQRASSGIPRLVNVLGHKALLAAFGRGDSAIDCGHIRKAIADTDGVSTKRQRSRLTKTFSSLFSPTVANI